VRRDRSLPLLLLFVVIARGRVALLWTLPQDGLACTGSGAFRRPPCALLFLVFCSTAWRDLPRDAHGTLCLWELLYVLARKNSKKKKERRSNVFLQMHLNARGSQTQRSGARYTSSREVCCAAPVTFEYGDGGDYTTHLTFCSRLTLRT